MNQENEALKNEPNKSKSNNKEQREFMLVYGQCSYAAQKSRSMTEFKERLASKNFEIVKYKDKDYIKATKLYSLDALLLNNRFKQLEVMDQDRKVQEQNLDIENLER